MSLFDKLFAGIFGMPAAVLGYVVVFPFAAMWFGATEAVADARYWFKRPSP